MEDLKDLPEDISLSLFERVVPNHVNGFFDHLMQNDFEATDFVSKDNALHDIEALLKKNLPQDIQEHDFYRDWLEDMAQVSKIFCDVQKADEISFWLGTKRGCRRYHIDYVPMRLLVTYAGLGTEWIPSEASDWEAYKNGADNDDICKDKSKIEQINPWDIAIFRGKEKGLLHKTPDHAICCPSVFMRLDNASFKRRLHRINGE